MSWQWGFLLAIFLLIAFIYLQGAGVFEWIHRRLNDQPKPTADITPGDLAVIRSDIEKLKLALNLKEFKR